MGSSESHPLLLYALARYSSSVAMIGKALVDFPVNPYSQPYGWSHVGENVTSGEASAQSNAGVGRRGSICATLHSA